MDKKKLFYRDEVHIPIILLDILKNLWLVVLAVAVACIGIFSYANLAHKPNYKADVTFVVSPRSNGSYVSFYASLNTASEMAGVFEEMFTSDVLNRIIKEDLKKPELSFEITALVVEGTNILSVSAESDTPENAHAVMQSVLKNYRQVSGYLFGGVVLDILKKPQIPVEPSNPFNTVLFMILGGVVSALFMMGLITLISILRPTVKTLACAKRRMEEMPLGVLQNERRPFRNFPKRQKLPPLITDTRTSFQYTESMLHVAYKIRHKMERDGKQILLVTSVAENEGKSTVSANIALALVRHGYKVAYIDMDLRKPAVHKIFNTLPKEDLMDCIRNGVPASLDSPELLHILALNSPKGSTDKLLHSKELVNLLNTLREKVDYIILDSSPYTATADTGMLLQHADCCVMIIRQDWVTYKICHDIVEDLGEGNAEYLGYVVNRYRDNGTAQTLKGRYGKYGYYGKSHAEE